MGSKTKARGNRLSTEDLFQHAQRSLEKGDAKQALKDAKVCFRQNTTQEHRAFLERAWLARVRELYRLGLQNEARDSAQGLLGFGVTEPTIHKELPQVLLLLGLFDQRAAQAGGLAEQVAPELLAAAADQAVLNPQTASASLPGIRSGAAVVRSALDQLYAGDEAAALAALREIPRHSPFADWRFFARGLAAYYRQDAEDMRANWDRLEGSRVAVRVAAPLRHLAEPASVPEDDQIRAGIRRLEKAAGNESIVSALRVLQRALKEQRWRDVNASLRGLREPLTRFAPDLLSRLVSLLARNAVRNGNRTRMEEFTRAAVPLPSDPKWNQTWAMFWEHGSDEEDDSEQAIRHWLAYIEDLRDLPDMREEERSLAQALVYEHLGSYYLIQEHEVEFEDEDDDEYWDDEAGADDAMLRRQAIDYLTRAVKLAPNLRTAYLAMARAHEHWDEPDAMAEAYRRLLQHFPDDLDALRALYFHHHRRDEGLEMRDYSLRMQRLKPTNRDVLDMLWTGHVAAARHLALKRKWDEGRAELAAAERLPNQPEAYVLLAAKTAFELKAGNGELGRQLAEQAKTKAPHPAAGLLALTIQAARYRLPYSLEGIAAGFEREWLASLKKKKSSAAAGRMAKMVAAYLHLGMEYPGHSQHVKQVFSYVKGCTRVGWEADDLERVCEFLMVLEDQDGTGVPRDPSLLPKLAAKGRKSFPGLALFHLVIGTQEVHKSPNRCNRRLARESLEKARDLAKNSTRPEDAAILAAAEKELTFLSEMDSPRAMPMPYFGPRGGREPDVVDDWCPDISAGAARTMFERICEKMGMDLDEVVERAERENIPIPPELIPILFPDQGRGAAKRKGQR